MNPTRSFSKNKPSYGKTTAVFMFTDISYISGSMILISFTHCQQKRFANLFNNDNSHKKIIIKPIYSF
eukprot:UN02174